MHDLRIAAPDCRIRIECNCKATYDSLNRYLLPAMPRVSADGVQDDLVVRAGRHGSLARVEGGEGMIAEARTIENLIPILQGLLDTAVMERLRSAVAVHAGVVSYRGSALLLPGASRAGKTTLVAELLKRGCEYFSDEYALIDDNGRVHPYARALMLRNGKSEQSPALPSSWGSRAGTAPAGVALVVAVAYSRTLRWSVRPVAQSAMLVTLLKSTPSRISQDRALFSPLLNALRPAACFAGVRGEADEAAEKILELVAARW